MNRQIYTIDATDIPLGRLATKIATVLMGKNKKSYDPRLDNGDSVAVENVEKIKLTGDKLNNKIYYRHSTHPGSLKSVKLKDLKARKGMKEVLVRAVAGMIPKNKRRKDLLRRIAVQ